jgi:hypothetical protein
MLEELKQLLAREGITRAAIIDDVYDDTPTVHDIDDEAWNFFLDDVSDSDVTIITDGYDVPDPERRWEQLRNDGNFIRFLWERREESDVFQRLFNSLIADRSKGRKQLEPLSSLLFTDLGLDGGTYGSKQSEEAAQAQVLFLDLFLGTYQDQAARDKAMNRVKAIVDPRRESPPIIVLMSSSTRLPTMRDEFRDEAGLLGCQFRMMQKSSLEEPEALQELLYRLTASYQDSLKLSSFLALWQLALFDATGRFMRNARRLDLRDYADLQTLSLNAEGELIGAYLMEVFGNYFQFELEEDARLSSAALKLNKMQWTDYPAPHFLPAAVSSEIADGMLFRSAKILEKAEPLQFGDVLFSSKVDILGAGSEPFVDLANGEKLALVVLTPACDLQHRYAKRLFFLAGVAKPSELLLHRKQDALITPILIHQGTHYVVEWELGAPVSWVPSDFAKQLDAGVFERVRSLRPLFSLQLQQRFTSNLSRVGTPVMPPMQHVAGVTISYRDKNARLHKLISFKAYDRQALLLVGRDENNNPLDRLMLDVDAISAIRIEMQGVDPENLQANQKDRWSKALQKRDLFSKMEQGIPYARRGPNRPFTDSDYDIVTVIGPHAGQANPITPERTIRNNKAGPLIIELSLEASVVPLHARAALSTSEHVTPTPAEASPAPKHTDALPMERSATPVEAQQSDGEPSEA